MDVSSGEIKASLDVIHQEIDQCRICAADVAGFRKPPHLDRGDPGRVMIVGQGPGNAEMHGQTAFAGQSGRTLNSWLESAGADPADPRKGIYFTSIIKCCSSGQKDFALMAHNCSSFLQRQMALIRPQLLITLGREAYMSLRFTTTDYEKALCGAEHSSDYLLVSQFDFQFWLLPWPHPSGLNRWHNLPENKKRLRASFTLLRRSLEGPL